MEPLRIRRRSLDETSREPDPNLEPAFVRFYLPDPEKRRRVMGLGVGLFLAAVGAVLAFAVNTTVSGVNIHTVGWILLIVGHRRNPALD